MGNEWLLLSSEKKETNQYLPQQDMQPMTTPFPYQTKAANQIGKYKGRSLVAMDMGTGKSRTALMYANANPDQRPIVIVCPATIKWNWERECMLHFGWRAEVLESTKPPKERLTLPRIVIINYEILHAWISALRKIKPKLIILDEVQYIGNGRARRTRACRSLCRNVKHVIALSGTPLTNRPAELYPILNILRPDLFPSWMTFAYEYCGPRRTPWGMDFRGSSNLGKLHKVLTENVMIRMRKEDVLKDLPPKRRSVITLNLDDPEEYRRAVVDFIGWLKEYDPKRASNAQRAERLTQLGYLKRLAARLKLRGVLSWVDQFLSENEDEKIILFAVHRNVIRRLHKHYGKSSVVVDGSVVGRKRQTVIDQFLIDRRTRVFIGNIRAAGVGWSAKGVSTVAFAELAWTPGAHTQCEDRVSGIGRGKVGVHASIYYLVAHETIESHLVELIQQKQEVLSATLDGRKSSKDLDIFDQLCRLIGRGK